MRRARRPRGRGAGRWSGDEPRARRGPARFAEPPALGSGGLGTARGSARCCAAASAALLTVQRGWVRTRAASPGVRPPDAVPESHGVSVLAAPASVHMDWCLTWPSLPASAFFPLVHLSRPRYPQLPVYLVQPSALTVQPYCISAMLLLFFKEALHFVKDINAPF